ncbi:MAG: type II toxin-antitoxin system death-on-curing family toxin [Cyclobacteriaceae bacterium]
MSFRWISKKAVIAIHHEQLTLHGGMSGIRDEGLLESALSRPQNLSVYEGAELYRCAAAYAFGITRNHPFNDGNKRTGFVTAVTFLLLNNHYITASETDVFLTITQLAEGNLSEEQLTTWFHEMTIPLS